MINHTIKSMLTWMLISCSIPLFAQQKPYTVKHDTINLHGFIYDSNGKPVDFIYIESTQLDFEHNTFKASTRTNDRGYFEL